MDIYDEVFDMGKFEGILLCSDFDGTFAKNAKVSDENRDAVRYFQSKGGMFVPASGRPSHFFKPYEDTFVASRYIIGLNGAEIFDIEEGRMVYSRALNRPHALALTHAILADHPEFQRVYIHNAVGGNHVTLDTWHLVDEIEGDVYKMVFSAVDADSALRISRQLSEWVPEGYLIERSWPEGVELLDKHNTKGACVERLRRMLGDRTRLVVCAGDYENDITLVKAADIGYAVGNAIPELRAVADRVTASVEQHAIAKIIEDLEKEI